MKTEITDIGDSKKRVKFTIPEEDVKRELNKVYQELGTTVKLKGFRPGKVPQQIIKKFFWRQIDQKLREDFIPPYYFKALEEAGLEPISTPEFDDYVIEANKPLLIIATQEVAPILELLDYKDIMVEKKELQHTEEDIEKLLKNLQLQNIN